VYFHFIDEHILSIHDILQDLTVDFLFLMPFVKIVQSFTGVIFQKCRSVYLYEIGTNITTMGNFNWRINFAQFSKQSMFSKRLRD